MPSVLIQIWFSSVGLSCVNVSTPCLLLFTAVEPHCLHTGHTEVAAEKSLQLLHTALLQLLRYAQAGCQTHSVVRRGHDVERRARVLEVTGCPPFLFIYLF